jgi:hypothetical protein
MEFEALLARVRKWAARRPDPGARKAVQDGGLYTIPKASWRVLSGPVQGL